jgi:drug/metabolite transporter (DMT)-like permease
MAHSDAAAMRTTAPVGRRDGPALAALSAAVLLWGASFAAMRVAVQALDPWAVMWLRMILATLLLLPFLPRLAPARRQAGDWRWLLPLVATQPCLYFLLESHALQYTSSSQAGVISASVPLMVAIGARLLLGEPLRRKTLWGLLLALSGVAILTGSAGGAGQGSDPLLGNALELLAMVCAAVNMVLVKRLSNRYGPWTLTGMQMAAGSLFFLPGLPVLVEAPPSLWTPRLIAILLFLGSLVTLGAFGLYNWGMSRLPAARAASFINLVPVAAVVIGWVVLGESLSGLQCLAAGVVLAGVWISQR